MEILTSVYTSLQDNQYFGAGFGLFGVGICLKFLKQTGRVAKIVGYRNLITSMEISSRDKSYKWLLEWITAHGEMGKSQQHLSVETNISFNSTGKVKGGFRYIPSPGDHIFYYKNRFIKVQRIRETTPGQLVSNAMFKSTSLDSTPAPFEVVRLSTFGRGNTFFQDMLKDSMKQALLDDLDVTVLYIPGPSDWRQFGNAKNRRSLDSVILKRGISENIISDVREFINSKDWYEKRGIPYRRGYLLHGPPGCGKSSFITALAGHLEYSICVLNIGDRGMTDERLHHLLNLVPDQSIILLEDIDAMFPNRESGENSIPTNRMTLSGLLNALDGVTSSEGRIIFMTTNYINRLDAALIRPGRVDVKHRIDHCTDDQILQMFQRFYPQEANHVASNFTVKLREHLQKNLPNESSKLNISPASLQGYFMLNKSCGQMSIENIYKFE